MSYRDTLTPEERAAYDASYVGSVDRLGREVRSLRHAVYAALPLSLRWLFRWLIDS